MQKYTLPPLPFDYDALEPVISGEIMKLHHLKHHATYVNSLNKFEAELSGAQVINDVSKMVQLESKIRFNAGGHINHSLFWQILIPNGTGLPVGELSDAIIRDFGSFEIMVSELAKVSISIQGSGWGWLGYSPIQDKLQIEITKDQDPLLATCGLIPILGIDVWEHAYYLQYKSDRAEYVHNIFKIVNWIKVEENFKNARANRTGVKID